MKLICFANFCTISTIIFISEAMNKIFHIMQVIIKLCKLLINKLSGAFVCMHPFF